MSAAHTPGLWQMSGMRTTSPPYKGLAIGPDGDPVVIVPYNDLDHHECLANARLLAAAPELLAALIAIEARHDDEDRAEAEGSFTEAWLALREQARAAIAKATGQ